MNHHKRGFYRDRLVRETITEWGCMDTEQIRIMFFPSQRVAQRRLSVLVSKGKLKRFRDTVEVPYSYFVQKHDIVRQTINWGRIWLLKRLKSWEVIDSFDYGSSTCHVRNTATAAVKIYNICYNAMKKTWLDGEVLAIYDTDEQRREASKRISGTLLTLDEIREGLKCQ